MRNVPFTIPYQLAKRLQESAANNGYANEHQVLIGDSGVSVVWYYNIDPAESTLTIWVSLNGGSTIVARNDLPLQQPLENYTQIQIQDMCRGLWSSISHIVNAAVKEKDSVVI